MIPCARIRQLLHQSDDARRILQQPLLQVIASLHASNFALLRSTLKVQSWMFDVLPVLRPPPSPLAFVQRSTLDVESSTFAFVNIELPTLNVQRPTHSV